MNDNDALRASDHELLRRFEPVLRFTRGERFLPMRIEPYLSRCSLWQQRPGREPEQIVAEGDVSPASLAEPRLAQFGTLLYLKFIAPLNLTELASYRLHRLQEGLTDRDAQNVFRAGRGRLARVGYGSRLVDALFQLSLLARGRVPGDTAAAAALAYERIMEETPQTAYYGRVVRQGGWIALQYWFFYAYNNWRSDFFGANDHEGDWEMICVYLAQVEGKITPVWVAYSAHEFSGQDMRRHWDDPDVEKVGEHPVVYVGAGSHASYFLPGEYLPEVELPFLAPLVSATDRVETLWRRTLRHDPRDEELSGESPSSFNVFRVPFVDYARGDGISVGPGQAREWDDLALLSPVPGWALHYRGMWGLYARDPFSGENAPAGPVYNRDGTVRESWYDPIGWSGLDRVPPPDEVLAYLQRRQEVVARRRAELAEGITRLSEDLMIMGVEARALQTRPHLEAAYLAHQERMDDVAAELDQLQAEYAATGSRVEALELYEARKLRGQAGPMRAHIRRLNRPASSVSLRFSRFAEVWAAVSIGVMLIAFVALFLTAPRYLGIGLVMLLSIFIFVEAGFRRQLPRLVSTVTIVLAFVAALVLLYEFFWQIVVGLVVLAGAYLMWENLRELWT